jgi:hypothetical protein
MATLSAYPSGAPRRRPRLLTVALSVYSSDAAWLRSGLTPPLPFFRLAAAAVAAVVPAVWPSASMAAGELMPLSLLELDPNSPVNEGSANLLAELFFLLVIPVGVYLACQILLWDYKVGPGPALS